MHVWRHRVVLPDRLSDDAHRAALTVEHRIIDRDLFQEAVNHPVHPGVAYVEHRDVVVEYAHPRQRGPEAAQFGVVADAAYLRADVDQSS
ncbi:Uncharacterised protein [Mycobacteroides abscessus subsp. abscessus]|nr:Uncharacterised protein [Mycobacteroides abscessus subsp. abscessus]